MFTGCASDSLPIHHQALHIASQCVCGDWQVPLVVVYGHSMAGAAIGVLTGNGKAVDGEGYLGFDGKYILPNATPVYFNKVAVKNAAAESLATPSSGPMPPQGFAWGGTF